MDRYYALASWIPRTQIRSRHEKICVDCGGVYVAIFFFIPLRRNYLQQECIPVGCVPAAAVCFPGGGVVCLVGGGLPGRGGVCLVPEGGGLPAWSGGGSACLVPGGSALPPCGQTHTCKNITLATTSLRPVTTHHH